MGQWNIYNHHLINRIWYQVRVLLSNTSMTSTVTDVIRMSSRTWEYLQCQASDLYEHAFFYFSIYTLKISGGGKTYSSYKKLA